MSTAFLTDQSKAAIGELLKSSGRKKLAVAYWGKEAAKELGIGKENGSRFKIICDLFSGACNPSEMTDLLSMGCELKTIDGLHTKLYISDDQVLIGSSNASSNGLAFSGADISRNIEANALIKDELFVRSAHSWFDQYWELSSALRVTPQLIDEAKPISTQRGTENETVSKSSQVRGYVQSCIAARAPSAS